MWIPNFVVKMFGRSLADKLKLQEGVPMPSKPWYQSKTIWSAIVSFVIALYGLVGQYLVPALGFHLPAIPGILLTFMSAMGLYGRVNATTTISS